VAAAAAPAATGRAGTERRDVTTHAGLATRTLAFAVDAAIINVVAWFVGVVVYLGLSLLHVPGEVQTILAAIGCGIALLWMVVYFAFFWSATGQTPGNRMLGIRVEDAATGTPIRAGRAALRVGALTLSAIPLCAGFLMILVDRRRRALHDRLIGTVVVYVASADGGLVAEGVTEVDGLLVRQVGAEHGDVAVGERNGDAVDGLPLADDEQRGGAGGDVLARPLDEVVLHAEVRQRAGESAGGGPERGPGERGEEDQREQHAPEAVP
jgi:uncharacterized RDD family membrane protein YckC